MRSIVHYTADEYGSVKVKLAEVLDRRGITRNRLRESCAGENGPESVGSFGLASGVFLAVWDIDCGKIVSPFWHRPKGRFFIIGRDGALFFGKDEKILDRSPASYSMIRVKGGVPYENQGGL